jgi:hypothetical protein
MFSPIPLPLLVAVAIIVIMFAALFQSPFDN